ncbi:uncharacterized protein DEA37_0000594 [Paragonimus westermani]|uniref:Protein FAM98A n=1 Tax=Paragonimus westermani TaxID=34504 RepID=A0A5J4P352_9TREM|nr:uncharacterized protein DEA37_0000594 [Paragonimus westermani]
MAPKYKNDLAKCFALLKLDYNWKTTCEDLATFARALSDITAQLINAFKSRESIQPIPPDVSPDSLMKSIEAFLTAYECPYSALTDPPLNERFDTPEKRMLLLRFLCTELMAHRRLAKLPQSAVSHASQASHQATTETNAELAAYLNLACSALGLSAPAVGFNLANTFGAIGKAASEAIKRCPPMHMGQSVLPMTGLSDRQWSQVARIAALLQQEYASRQATLLKRSDVTVQSFKWSDKAKTQLQAIAAVYQPFRSALAKSAFPGIPELLAVRDNMILRIEKTSGVHGRRYTSCPLNKILIGQVPDRGGRAWELEPPPPEMPSFKQRQPERGGRGGPGGPVGGGGRPDSGRGGSRGQGDYGRGRGGDFTHGVQQFRPPAPSAHLGGGDYVVSGSAYAALNQQLSGLAFEPGIAVGQPQGYVFQPINMQDGSYRGGYAPQMRGRGGRGRGNRGRPF